MPIGVLTPAATIDKNRKNRQFGTVALPSANRPLQWQQGDPAYPIAPSMQWDPVTVLGAGGSAGRQWAPSTQMGNQLQVFGNARPILTRPVNPLFSDSQNRELGGLHSLLASLREMTANPWPTSPEAGFHNQIMGKYQQNAADTAQRWMRDAANPAWANRMAKQEFTPGVIDAAAAKSAAALGLAPARAAQPDLGVNPFDSRYAAAAAADQERAARNALAADTMQKASKVNVLAGRESSPANPFPTPFNIDPATNKPTRSVWNEYLAKADAANKAAESGDVAGAAAWPGTWQGNAVDRSDPQLSARLAALGLTTNATGAIVGRSGRAASTSQLADLQTANQGVAERLGLKPGATQGDVGRAVDARRKAVGDMRQLMVAARAMGQPMTEDQARYRMIVNNGGTPSIDQSILAIGPEATAATNKDLVASRLAASILGQNVANGGGGAPIIAQGVQGLMNALRGNAGAGAPGVNQGVPLPLADKSTGAISTSAALETMRTKYGNDFASDPAKKAMVLSELGTMGIGPDALQAELDEATVRWPTWNRMFTSRNTIHKQRRRYSNVAPILGKEENPGF